jgi:hypothetical protein
MIAQYIQLILLEPIKFFNEEGFQSQVEHHRYANDHQVSAVGFPGQGSGQQ